MVSDLNGMLTGSLSVYVNQMTMQIKLIIFIFGLIYITLLRGIGFFYCIYMGVVLSDANKRLLYDVGVYDSDDDNVSFSTS